MLIAATVTEFSLVTVSVCIKISLLLFVFIEHIRPGTCMLCLKSLLYFPSIQNVPI